jgi:chlorophyll/bacteriochlorophyll a synthase
MTRQSTASLLGDIRWPAPAAVLEVLKPITWFPPIWAFACGVVASGADFADAWPLGLLGLLLAGPAVCGMSQAVNDWFDRHVDAVNEPERPIPSGRLPGRWGLHLALIWTLISLLLGSALGPWGFAATLVGVSLAWAYSAPPIRLKANGWWGNLACGLAYETLPWITGTTVLVGAAPGARSIVLALCFGLAAHGIMTLNDFKSIVGDARFGIRSLPVQLGPERAARLAALVMAVPQLLIMGLLLRWGLWLAAGLVFLLLVGQAVAMWRMLQDPRRLAPWYNATGVLMFVIGMMVCAVALRP